MKEAMSDKRYWLMVAALGGAAVPVGGFLSQLQPILISHNYTATAAASVLTAFAVGIAVGRLLAGVMLDRFNPSRVAAVCFVLPALGVVLLSGTAGDTSPWLLAAVGVFLIGFGQGAEADFVAFFTLRLFGLRRFAAIFGTVAIAVGGGMAIGGLLFAGLYDLLGGYQTAMYVGGAAFVLASITVMMIRFPPAGAHIK
jgi:MFS family permease